MRVFLMVICLSYGLISCQHTDSRKPDAGAMIIPKDSSLFTSIRWEDSTVRDFGIIEEGRKLDVSYRFLNVGNKPLIIARVQPSCGCTIAEQPGEPILPGKEGVIKASFNSEGRRGINHKKLYVFANTLGSQSSELEFSVTVEKKKW